MKYCHTLAPIALACLAGAATGQVLFDNGPLSTGATTSSGVAAPAGSTWSEVQGDTAACSDTNAGYACSVASAFRMADDFTIPAGQSWNVTGVVIWAYQTGQPTTGTPFTACTLQIWSGTPGAGGAVVFGNTVTNRLSSAGWDNMYRIFNTTGPFPNVQGTTRAVNKLQLTAATTLGPGTYWVDYQTQVTNAGTHFSPQVTIVGSPTSPGANGMQFNGATWAPMIDTGVGVGGVAGCHSIPHAAPFRILGTVSTSCYADCDHVGGLTANDFQCFLNAFVANAAYADCDGVGGLTANDFQCFLNKFVAGCS